jgi:hypothetical protein
MALRCLAKAAVIKVELLKTGVLCKSESQGDRTGYSEDVAGKAEIRYGLAGNKTSHETVDTPTSNLIKTKIQS